MFEWNQIESLNELEMRVYSYVLAHTDEVSRMKIRELAEATHVSTSTILRFCNKLGCEGYSEFRFRLREAPQQDNPGRYQNYAKQMIDFLQNASNDSELELRLAEASRIICAADRVIFYGIGSSGALWPGCPTCILPPICPRCVPTMKQMTWT